MNSTLNKRKKTYASEPLILPALMFMLFIISNNLQAESEKDAQIDASLFEGTEQSPLRTAPKPIDQTQSSQTINPEPDENKIWNYAAGLNLSWSVRRDYGARTFKRFEPELVGYKYTQLPQPRLWLRHGARLGFSKDQPQMPKALRVEETDWKISVEEGIAWDWYVVPSLTYGLGYDWRTTTVKTAPPITSNDERVNTKEGFIWNYIQLGIGIPAMHGAYVLEPIMRWQFLSLDDRTNWAYGFELSKAW